MIEQQPTHEELAAEVARLRRRVAELEHAEDGQSRSERNRFHQAVESAPNAIVMIDRQGRIVLVNAQTERLFGYGRQEMLGQPVEILVPERFRARHPGDRAAFFEQPASRKMGEGRELFGRRRDGSEFPVEIGLTPIETEEGLMVISAIVDITERRRADEKFRLAVESAPNAIVMINREGLIMLVNRQTERLFGYPREQILGQPIELLVPMRYRQSHVGDRVRFFDTPTARAMGEGRDLFGLRSDGSEFPVEIGLTPIETAEGPVVLSAVVDISQRKAAEQELSLAAAELAQSNRELENFAYVASHDLQEPLRTIAGHLQLIESECRAKLSEDALVSIGFVIDGAKRMKTLINDLLTYSRVQTRGREMLPTDAAHLVETIIHDLAAALEESGAAVTRDALPIVHADAPQLEMTLRNLITNAIKFRGKEKPRIHVGVRETPEEFVFSVADNGIGIEPQYWQRIFEIFQRLHTQDEYPGTGIGLAVCKGVIERHGGRIWVESTPGKGSTFFFSIPRKPKARKHAITQHQHG